MKISTKAWLATCTTLATIGLIAAAFWLAEMNAGEASLQSTQADEIAMKLTELRLVTFEYILHRQERARAQWRTVSEHLDGLIGQGAFSGPSETQVIASLREGSERTKALFAELSSSASGDGAVLAQDDPERRFEAQLSTRLLIQLQENLTRAFDLARLADQRMAEAQRRVLIVALGGLTLIALITAGAFWLLRRDVLAPIARLQRAAREIAAGNWKFRLGIGGHDEIGELSRNFNAMTRALESSFAQIERNNQDLDALNKELESFSYSVSHDLRAPLRSMDGFSLVLLEDYGDRLDDEGKDAIARIRAASQRMGDLIDDLLRLSQVSRAELNLEGVDVSAMAREIAAILEREPRQRPVQWLIEEGMTLRADRPLIRIALQNLMQNAWKFTGKAETPVIRIGVLERDGGEVHFVADNGVGFDMAHASYLFGAFRRLHPVADFPGTGVGLAIVERIIRRHQGRIWAEAKPDEGATFFFTVAQPGSDLHG
ncbi:MAG: sensor histidine kinase [Usitatibacter sp.]